jgi:hypothetical protein
MRKIITALFCKFCLNVYPPLKKSFCLSVIKLLYNLNESLANLLIPNSSIDVLKIHSFNLGGTEEAVKVIAFSHKGKYTLKRFTSDKICATLAITEKEINYFCLL